MKNILITLILVIIFGLANTVSALEYQGRLIKPGMSGEDVQALQECLLNMGFELPLYGADSSYGSETYLQITDYQRSQNLQFIDGIVGPETAAALTCEPAANESSVAVQSVSINGVEVEITSQDGIEIAAELVEMEGEMNDTVNYTYTFDLVAEDTDMYISEDAEKSVEYTIFDVSSNTLVHDSDGEVQEGEAVLALWSSTVLEDGYYVIKQGETQRLEVIISFDPYAGDKAGFGSYVVQLDGVNYKEETSLESQEVYDISENPAFRSNSVNIID